MNILTKYLPFWKGILFFKRFADPIQFMLSLDLINETENNISKNYSSFSIILGFILV